MNNAAQIRYSFKLFCRMRYPTPALVALAILALCTTACRPGRSPSPTTIVLTASQDLWAHVDPYGQTITFWHQYSQERESSLQEILEEFNHTNTWGITVIPEKQGGYGDIFNKMQAAMNTPDVPDLVLAFQDQAASYQLAGALLDMTSLVSSTEWGLSSVDQADFFPYILTQDIFPALGNVRLGFPLDRSMDLMYYNIDWLHELGYVGPPTTPEEFKEMACAAIERPFSGATAEGSMGYKLSIDASRFATLTFAFGGDVFDYQVSQYSYNNDFAVAAMVFLQDLFVSGCATTVAERYSDQFDFAAGRLLFTIGSSSGLPFYKSAIEDDANFNWGVASIPHITPDPVMNIYGASISILKTTPERELAAWLFLKYYTSPSVQVRWAIAGNHLPVRASAADGLSTYFSDNPTYHTAFDLLQFGKFEPSVPGYDLVRLLVEETLVAIIDGADVESSLDALTVEAQSILKEQTINLPPPDY